MSDKFTFKQFNVSHSKSTMKVSTDSTLLGAWVDTTNTRNILDIGSGCGILSLMLAQKSRANITAIEPDADSIAESRENFNNSPWPDRLTLVQTHLQDFTNDKSWDCIVSNPPYFEMEKSYPMPDSSRKKARTTQTLRLEEILHFSSTHLSVQGQLNLVLPISHEFNLISLAEEYDLFPIRCLKVRNNPRKAFSLFLIAFGREKQKYFCEEIRLYDEAQQATAAYKLLTKEYLLWKNDNFIDSQTKAIG